jgi:predicted nucleotidyltransferase
MQAGRMSWRTPPFDAAIADLAAYVRATWSPLGVIAAGSIVRGEAGPNSDFDVFIVHDKPWRLREQRRFCGVPAELFVNPAQQVRRYFETEHAEGRPCTAHMFATGEIIEHHPILDELVTEARDWLARPLAPTELQLTQQRYGAVDALDDARDVIDDDPTAAALLLADCVRQIIEHAFWARRQFQPRRKAAVRALAAIDPGAADLVERWTAAPTPAEALAVVEALARHVLDADTFFAWSSGEGSVG